MDWVESELARISGPEYVADLERVALADLRAMRDECERLEVVLSYSRRMTQGRIDVVRATLAERPGDMGVGGNDAAAGMSSYGGDSMTERLTAIMASGPPRPSGSGRMSKSFFPDFETDDILAELSSVLSETQLVHLQELSSQELTEILSGLTDIESQLSAQRRSVHGVMDAIDAEIAKWYKEGLATVDALVDGRNGTA
ncbi:MAG: RsiG family protein [Acidimicrobiales bacterium]